MRRIAVVAGMTLAILALSGAAGAQTYPPEVASITVSDATLSCPQPFTVSGEGFVPGDEIAVTFDGEGIGSATADAQGEFSIEVTAPAAAAGSHTVTASNTLSASATVSCVAAAGGPAAGPGVAFTGANITVGLLVLVGLLVAGAAALLIGRRRATTQR